MKDIEREILFSFLNVHILGNTEEGTILFPALRSIFSNNEYPSLGEEFEKKEHQLFGSEGFEGALDLAAGIEKKLGIHDPSQCTPR
jgi:hypothetical protein